MMEKNFDRLQVGKRYKRRDGEVVQIVDSILKFLFVCRKNYFYFPDGGCFLGKGRYDDLVEEIPAEPTKETQNEFERGRASVIQELKDSGVLVAIEFYSKNSSWLRGVCHDLAREIIPEDISSDQNCPFVGGKHARECLPKLKKIMGEQ